MLSEYQTRLLDFYLGCLRYEGDADLLDVSFGAPAPGGPLTIKVARLELPCDDGSTLFVSASLGRNTAPRPRERQFLGIYDSELPALTELAAASWHYDASVAELDHGHSFPLPTESALRATGYSAALILRASLYAPFDVPSPVLEGVPTALFAVLPLTELELAGKREQGLQHLLDGWQTAEKDLLHIRGSDDA